jgi:tRNA(fMet)-specific endonuclease VapC
MIYLLDTDTIIHLARGVRITKPSNQSQRNRARMAATIVNKCRALQGSGDDLGVSSITAAELELGARNGGNYPEESAAIRKILTPFQIFSFEGTMCPVEYGLVRYELQTAGKLIGAMDLLIAAHAKAMGATLVTGNVSHFKRIKQLTCETWLK